MAIVRVLSFDGDDRWVHMDANSGPFSLAFNFDAKTARAMGEWLIAAADEMGASDAP
jgi:hypothetical protein